MTDTILTLDKANMFAGREPSDVNQGLYLELTEFKLPAMNEQYVDHRAGGVPIGIEVDTMFAKMEATFQLIGWNLQVATLVNSWLAEQNVFWIYGLLRDRMTAEAMRVTAKLRGRLGLADPQNWNRGAAQHWNYAIKGIIAYQLSVENSLIYDWDFFSNRFVVGQFDRNADVNRILNVPTPTASPVVPPPPAVVTA
jgi:P2 family phage contractile tail tube protein